MIDDKHDKFDQLLGDKLSTMREMPSEGVWDRIEATLAQMEAPAVVAAPAKPKRTRKKKAETEEKEEKEGKEGK